MEDTRRGTFSFGSCENDNDIKIDNIKAIWFINSS